MKKVLMLGLILLWIWNDVRASDEDWCCIPVIKQVYMAHPRAMDELQQMLDDGADPNTATSSGHTALMVAAGRGNVQAMQVLLEAGANARAVTHKERTTALHCLAMADFNYCMVCSGHTREQAEKVLQGKARRLLAGVDMLLAAGADVNALDSTGASPFVLAVRHSPIVAEYLLQHGAVMPAEGSAGYKMILESLEEGNVHSVPVLLKAGLNVETRMADGRSLLMLAANMLHADVVKALLEAGADVHYVAPSGRTALSETRGARFYSNRPQHQAKRLEVARMLLNAGADPLQQQNGCNHFHLAASSKDVEMIRLLCEYCPEGVNVPTTKEKTPLMIAAAVADLETIRALLAAGADVHARDENQRSVLASAAGSTVIDYDGDRLQVLADAGADVKKDGHDALVAACQTGREKAVRWLLAAGVDANATVGEHGNTLLHAATWNRNGGVVEALIQGGAQVNAQNSVGNTPLHFAVQYGHPQVWHVVSVLLREGADPHLRNHYGKTPLDWASPDIKQKLAQLPGIMQVEDSEAKP